MFLYDTDFAIRVNYFLWGTLVGIIAPEYHAFKEKKKANESRCPHNLAEQNQSEMGIIPPSPLSPSDKQLLLCHTEQGIATLTLNRPRQYNALSETLLAALEAALDEIANDRNVRVVVLTGNGQAFCAGHDLKEMRANPKHQYYEGLFRRCTEVMMRISRLPQPVIARVHGLAAAAGCQLVAASDLAVAADTARFAVSGINVGLFCSTPAVALSRNILRKRAFEMLITGEFVDAKTAMRYGLINSAVPPEELDRAVGNLTNNIVNKSAVAVEMGKRMFYKQFAYDLETAYEYAGHVMAANMMVEDAMNGIDGFLGR
uniref:Enoyl-CoA hydratase domain-containing protein 3, mitochondrial n=1 Tax=Candidatus Kentrum sp. FM TaxID=2126340 RepID=A0A450WKU8_9GAMM|nr:MAG: Enoyl-CoA hydratase/carnithine racemase [Candidatus Kentron sp. FM]VFJ49985.1 MAG: Enoyl-CoA hydratase/carnithine racemase [Candidatus Kentron sp. FM]VFK17634.1 MAG: Enoyl-CoA hydratase/carnithine racemase [Candidatus Kentron sp. FM]